MSETVRSSSFQNAMEEVVEKMDEINEVEQLSEDEELNEYKELLKMNPFSIDFIAGFLLDLDSDKEEDKVELGYIFEEIKMEADDKGEEPEILFYRMLRFAREMDGKKDKYAGVDNSVVEDN